MTSDQELAIVFNTLKRIVAQRCIDCPFEAQVVTEMQFWQVNLTNPANIKTLMANLSGTPIVFDETNVRKDFAVGLTWFNALTDSEVVLTIPYGLDSEVRDHDGDGQNEMGWWYGDDLADPDSTLESLMLDSINTFVCYCRNRLIEYENGLSYYRKDITPAVFKKMLEDDLIILQKDE